MTRPPSVLGQAMHASDVARGVFVLALPGDVFLVVYRLSRGWRPWRGTLQRPNEKSQHVRAWRAQWAATKLARRLGRPGVPVRTDRSRAREQPPTDPTAPGTPALPGGPA